MKIHRTVIEMFVRGAVFVIALLVLYFAVTGKVWANHDTILAIQGKVKVADATCPIGKSGLMDKTSDFRVPCILVVDLADDTKFWVVIESNDGIALWVIEVTNKDSSQKVVWKYGGKVL
ncbi:MAG: hypothetical protein AAB922_07750 [Patescibacteria group bacterium]